MRNGIAGMLTPVPQETAAAGSYAEAQLFLPMTLREPAAGDVGIVMGQTFFPVVDGAPSLKDPVLKVEVPVAPVKKYCLQVEDVQILPVMNPKLTALNLPRIIDPVNPSREGNIYSAPLYIISDTPTEDDPNFDERDKDDPEYIRNEGIRFSSLTHAEYDEESFDPEQGLTYIYAYNEENLIPQSLVERYTSASAAYTAAQTVTTAAYNKYQTASYALKYPTVYAKRQEAYQTAYDASYNAARADLTAAETALANVQASRDAAAQAAYNEAAEDYADDMATAQAAESAASAAYYQAESDASTAAQVAYDSAYQTAYSSTYQSTYDQAILDGLSAEEAASMAASAAESAGQEAGNAAQQAEYNNQQPLINAAFNVWMEKANVLWELQYQQQNAGYAAYQTEYDSWADRVNAAQSAYDAALSAFNESEATEDAVAAGESAAAAFDDELAAAKEYDENVVPQYKAADYRAYLVAQENERLANLKAQVAYRAQFPGSGAIQTSTYYGPNLCPHPDLRCYPVDLATCSPFSTNPDDPIDAVGTVWNGKPFTPPERVLYTNGTYSRRPFLLLRVRAYRKGRLLSNLSTAAILRIPGKIVIEYDKDTRKLKVTTPYSTYAKISAEYATLGGHLLTNAESGTEVVVNASDTVRITLNVPQDAEADVWVKKYVSAIFVNLVVTGDETEQTAGFIKTIWVPMPPRGDIATQTIAVRLTEQPDYYVSAGGTGNGLTPDSPGSWDSILDAVAGLSNSTGYRNLTDKVIWLSGNPKTAQSTFRVPYGTTIRGGWNADFTAITGKSLLTKKTSMPLSMNGSTFENFQANGPDIFFGDFVFRNCSLACNYTRPDTVTVTPYVWYARKMIGCTVDWSGLDGRIYAQYGLQNCQITGAGLKLIGGNISDSAVTISDTTKFSIQGNSNFSGSFYTDNDVVNYLDNLIASTNVGTAVIKKMGIAGNYTSDTPVIQNSVINVTLKDGANGVNGKSVVNTGSIGGASGSAGAAGESLVCAIPGPVLNSDITIRLGKAGDGGQGGNGYAGNWVGYTGYSGPGGNGGCCLVILPAKVKDSSITVSGGGFGLGGAAGGHAPDVQQPGWYATWSKASDLHPTDGTVLPPWYLKFMGERYYFGDTPGRKGRFFIQRPVYWCNASFPTSPNDDLQKRYRLADLSDCYNQYRAFLNGDNTSITLIGKTADALYWGSAGRAALPGSYSVTTEDGWTVPVRGYFGTDGGAAGNGAPLDGQEAAGAAASGAAVAGIEGKTGIAVGPYFE